MGYKIFLDGDYEIGVHWYDDDEPSISWRLTFAWNRASGRQTQQLIERLDGAVTYQYVFDDQGKITRWALKDAVSRRYYWPTQTAPAALMHGSTTAQQILDGTNIVSEYQRAKATLVYELNMIRISLEERP